MLFRTPPLDSPDVSERGNPSPIEPDKNNTNFMHNGENNLPGGSTRQGGEEDSDPGQLPDDDHGIQHPENNDTKNYEKRTATPPVITTLTISDAQIEAAVAKVGESLAAGMRRALEEFRTALDRNRAKTAKPAATGVVTLAPPRVPIQNLWPVKTQDAKKGRIVNYEGLPNRGDKKETDEGWQTARQNRRCNTAIGCSVDIQPTVEEESRRKDVASQSSGPVSARLGTDPGYTSRLTQSGARHSVVGGVIPERSGQDLGEGSVGGSMIKASPPGRVESADDRGFVATGQADQGTSVMNSLETESSCRSQSSPANEGLLKRELPSQPARIKVACPLVSPTPHSSLMKNHANITDFNAWHGNTPPDIEFYDHTHAGIPSDTVYVSAIVRPTNSQTLFQTPFMSLGYTQMGARVHPGDTTTRDSTGNSRCGNPSETADFVPVHSCNVYYVSIYNRYKTVVMGTYPGPMRQLDKNTTNYASTMSKLCGGEKPTSRGNSTLNLDPRGAEPPEPSIVMSLCGNIGNQRSYDIPWFHQNREMLWVQRKFKFQDGFENLCSLYSMESTPKTERLRNTDCPENQAVRISLSTLFLCGKILYLEVRYACAELESSAPSLPPDWALAELDEIVDDSATPDESCQDGRRLSGVGNWRQVPPENVNPVCASSSFVYYASIYSRYKTAAMRLYPGPTEPPDKNFMITKIMREQCRGQKSSFRGNFMLKDSPRGAEPPGFPIIMPLRENHSYGSPGSALGWEILWLKRKIESDKGFGFGCDRNFMETGPKPAEGLNLISPESRAEPKPPMTSNLCNRNLYFMPRYGSGSTSPEISMLVGCTRKEPGETRCLPISPDAVRQPGKIKDGVTEESRYGVPAALIIALYALIYFVYYVSTYSRFKTSCPNGSQTEDSLAEFLSLGETASLHPIGATTEAERRPDIMFKSNTFVSVTNYDGLAPPSDGYLQRSPSEFDAVMTEWSPSPNRVRQESQQSSNRAQQVGQGFKSEVRLQLVGETSDVIGMSDSLNSSDLKVQQRIETGYGTKSMKWGKFYEIKRKMNRTKLPNIMPVKCPETCGATAPKAQKLANNLCKKEECRTESSLANRLVPKETVPNVSLRLLVSRESLNAAKPRVCRVLTLLLILYAMSLEKGGSKYPISSSPPQIVPLIMSPWKNRCYNVSRTAAIQEVTWLWEIFKLRPVFEPENARNPTPTTLARSDHNQEFSLTIDASDECSDDGKSRIIRWASRFMENAKTRYCATKQQPLSCSSGLDDLESAMLGTKIYVVVGKKPLQVRDSKTARINRWKSQLLEYQSSAGGDLFSKYQRGKSHHVADALSGNPVLTPEKTEEMHRLGDGMDPGDRKLDQVCSRGIDRLEDIMGCRDSSTSAEDDCEQCQIGEYLENHLNNVILWSMANASHEGYIREGTQELLEMDMKRGPSDHLLRAGERDQAEDGPINLKRPGETTPQHSLHPSITPEALKLMKETAQIDPEMQATRKFMCLNIMPTSEHLKQWLEKVGSSWAWTEKPIALRKHDVMLGETVYQLILPSTFRQTVVWKSHSSMGMGRHQPRGKMLKSIEKLCYWPKPLDRKTYIERLCWCPEVRKLRALGCAAEKGQGSFNKPLLESTPPPMKSYQRIPVDVLKIGTSEKGNTYLLVPVDFLPKFPYPSVMKTQEAKESQSPFLQVFQIIGYPEELLTAQGSQSTRILMQEFCKMAVMKPFVTTTYDTAGNLNTEHMTRTIMTISKPLVLTVLKDLDQRNEELPYTMLKIIMTPHTTTKQSTCEFMFDRDPHLPGATLLMMVKGSEWDEDLSIQRNVQWALNWAHRDTPLRQMDMEAQRDWKASSRDSTVRDEAWICHPGERKSKSSPEMLGSFTIIMIDIGNNRYQVVPSKAKTPDNLVLWITVHEGRVIRKFMERNIMQGYNTHSKAARQEIEVQFCFHCCTPDNCASLGWKRLVERTLQHPRKVHLMNIQRADSVNSMKLPKLGKGLSVEVAEAEFRNKMYYFMNKFGQYAPKMDQLTEYHDDETIGPEYNRNFYDSLIFLSKNSGKLSRSVRNLCLDYGSDVEILSCSYASASELRNSALRHQGNPVSIPNFYDRTESWKLYERIRPKISDFTITPEPDQKMESRWEKNQPIFPEYYDACGEDLSELPPIMQFEGNETETPQLSLERKGQENPRKLDCIPQDDNLDLRRWKTLGSDRVSGFTSHPESSPGTHPLPTSGCPKLFWGETETSILMSLCETPMLGPSAVFPTIVPVDQRSEDGETKLANAEVIPTAGDVELAGPGHFGKKSSILPGEDWRQCVHMNMPAFAPCINRIDFGAGEKRLARWYFNPTTRACENFAYKGSRGNSNNFLTRGDCEATCPALQQACNGLRPSEGQGNGVLPRYYYDLSSRSCRSFTYRGAKGNPNNFYSQSDCEGTCPVWTNPCPLPVDSPNYCSAGGFGDVCGAGQWCHIGADTDTTVCCPGAGDACTQPLDQGVGSAVLPRFYYDINTRTCVGFNYRGTKGNQNNFVSLNQCESRCPVFLNPCSQGSPYLDPQNRPQTCNALTTTSSCPTGYWCHVGADIDTTVCCPGAQDPCNLSRSTGSGNANLPRWYYDSSARSCQQFTYTGVGGNQNNFVSQQACRLVCREFQNPCIGQPATSPSGQPVFCSVTNRDNCPVNFWCHIGATAETTLCCPGATNPCSVPLAPGTGSSTLSRYYYNADTRKCVSFQYYGMRGNQNNFLTDSECSRTCPVWINPCSGGPPATSPGSNRALQCGGIYGGSSCPSGYWCHTGSKTDDSVCCPGATDDVCALPRIEGTGQENLNRWYFDNLNRKCEQYTYNGRNGNQNSFQSREDCLRECPEFDNPCLYGEMLMTGGRPWKCRPGEFSSQCPQESYYCLMGQDFGVCCPYQNRAPTKDPCMAPRRDGEGNFSLQRFFYNAISRSCELFFYRGRKGNENNFLTKAECEDKCVPDSNPCYLGDEPYQQGGRNVLCTPDYDTCPNSHYCHAGEDEFSTVCCPKRGSPCDQQLLPGTGTARLPRFYYDSKEDECLPFTYTGQAGNQNNFLSKAVCEDACPGFRSYCPHGKPLLVGGVPEECGVEQACPNSYVCHINTIISRSICCFDPAYFCILPRDPGPCTNFETRYGYNRNTGTCTPFQYGSCRGNMNNFASLEECTEICCDKGY